MSLQNFDSLWAALMEPVRELQDDVANINRQAVRAETAGAVEVVASLPTAGEKGRLLYLSTDNTIYFDNGTSWVALGGGIKPSVYTTFLSANFDTSSTSYVDVTGTSQSHTFTKNNALIVVSYGGVADVATQIYVRLNVDGTAGTKESGLHYSALKTNIVADVFDVSAVSSPATIKLQAKKVGTGSTVTINRQVFLVFLIVEYD